MPTPNHVNRYDPAGTSKTVDSQQTIDLFGFPGVHQIGSVLDCLTIFGGKGRRQSYPPTAMFACLVAARVATSQAEALKIIRVHWEECRQRYARRGGVLLTRTPPTYDQVKYFRKRLLGRPGLLAQLQQQFQTLAIGQARIHGNLLPGIAPDWANPNPAHSIYGDGTVIAPGSDVRQILHPLTGEVTLIGSRAQTVERARIQRVLSDTEADEKDVRGLNMVAIHTWTTAGRIVLGTGTALGAEVWAALDLVDSIHSKCGDGIHSLIYDRAITGRSVDYLMGALRIQALTKAVGRKKSTNASDAMIHDPELADRVHQRGAGVGVKPGSLPSHLLRRDVLADMLRYHQKMPVGLMIYPTKGRNFDLVHSEYMDLDDASHDTADGECRHSLVVDDGALFLVEDDAEESYRVKTQLLTCITSTPITRSEGNFGRRNQYIVHCENGDFAYEHEWLPEAIRYTAETPESGKRTAPVNPVGWRLRPLSRPDDLTEWFNHDTPVAEIVERRFSRHFSRRNDAESYNEWFQNTLPHHGRAATVDLAGQELDFLCAAILNNSITWSNRDN